MLKEFRDFIARGNVIDLAVAVIIGAAFGKVVNTLVEGVLMPPLGMLLGNVDFSSLFVVLDHSKGTPASIAAAKAAGIPVIAYGLFINDVVNFLILAFAVFMIVKQANRFKKALICVDHCIRQHARLVCFRNEPAVMVNFFEIHATHPRKLGSPNHPKFDGSRIDDKWRP